MPDRTTAETPPAVALEAGYRVRFDEAGGNGLVHPSVLLAWAQDAAWLHSTALGFGRDWYADRGLTWLVRAAELTLLDPPSSGDEVLVRTEIVGFRRVLARRLTTVGAADGGRELARSLTDWALTDGRGRPTRIPDVFTRLATVPSFEPLAVPPAPADSRVVAEIALTVRRRDVDPLGHANNAAFLAAVDEAMDATAMGVPTVLPRQYAIVYLRPAPAGVAISALVQVLGSTALVEFRLDGEATPVARATVEWGSS